MPSRVFAPYFGTWNSATLQQLSQGSGVKYYTMAFVLGGGSGCQAMWNGSDPVTGGSRAAEINSLRAAGGDVIISFGGASAPYLEQFCSTSASLEAQFQAVVDTYGVNSLDFDVEDMWLQATFDMRNQALAQLEKVRNVSISYTLPVDTAGLTSLDITLLRSAIANGVNVSVVNGMTMDYGGSVSDMGAAAITAANSMFSQLQQLYPSKTPAQVWAMVGITPMIGQNDSSGEIFTTANAQAVLSFAKNKGVGRLAFWEASRDKPCPGGGAQDTCSGIGGSQWDFSTIFNQFNSGSPAPSPTPTPTPTPKPSPTPTPTPIVGPPGQPTNVSSQSAGSGQADVSWTPPSADGGSPVTYYAVYGFSYSGKPIEWGTASNPFLAQGLTGGQYYTFTVIAWNGTSWGSWSGWSGWVLA
jgi:chitinase